MDYSKVKYVKPSVDGIGYGKQKGYFTKGRVYEVQGDFLNVECCYVINDLGKRNLILIPECAHLDDSHWIPCTKDGTPL